MHLRNYAPSHELGSKCIREEIGINPMFCEYVVSLSVWMSFQQPIVLDAVLWFTLSSS
jgi:hypothetical protein